MHGDVLDIQFVRLSGGLASVPSTDMAAILGGGILGSRTILGAFLVAIPAFYAYIRSRMM